MSIITSVEDEMRSLLDMLHGQPPIDRLAYALAIEQAFTKLVRELKQEAAYDARMQYTIGDIAEILEVDRKSIEYLVRTYMERHPYKDAPPHHNRSKIDRFVDLTHES